MRASLISAGWQIFALPAALSSLTDADFYGQSPPVYPSPEGKGSGKWAGAYVNARDLVGQMTLEEKVNITRGFNSSDNVCAGNSGSVPRLQWPGMCLHDAGNGVRATDMVNAYASGIHVGASWDRNLTYQRGYFMGKEFKDKGGFPWEHFVGNEQETLRRPYHGIEAASTNIDDKTMHELYAWPFMDGVHAGVGSIMCSYNRVNNSYGCQNSKLMNGILKSELSFDGFVVADWNGQHSGVGSALAGLDMVMPLGGYWGDNLTEAVHNGSVPESRVTDMATRYNTTDFATPGFGMKNLTEPHEAVDARDPKSKPIILEGAIAGHVLVKNENSTLPFKKPPKMISLYGYDATVPATKNTDILFQLGYNVQPEMAQAVLGTEGVRFDQAAKGGTIVAGGRAAANSPAYISDPLSALSQRAALDDTWVNWDLTSFDPDVNGASEACLVFINAMATEGWDRTGLHDDFSDGLVLNVASKCSNTIVVIHAAGIRLVDQWIAHQNVTATIIAHLPGQDSGQALVKLLYGEAGFSGKLPYTLARNESDYHPYLPCNRTPDDYFPQCDFTEGVYIDYRDFDARNITPRFEFGFGLSYTSFEYSWLSVDASFLSPTTCGSSDNEIWDIVATVQATVTNTGPVEGAEVAQLYLAIPNRPPKQLRGFGKVALDPGESAEVTFELTRRDFSVWDAVTQEWQIQEGDYTIFVGASSRDIRLTHNLKV
ncbi:hypothetical protein DL770_000573 [Monosporascus sp. CRB-9-2]|nr:hypothetical protein DL770_000573 [Monosporascus sp. CRB-9-2]